MTSDAAPLLNAIRWNGDGLVAAIIQDAADGTVLMMAWMDRPAVSRTLTTGQTHFYSRSRQTAWHKGGTSGHVQHVKGVRLDCDGDVLLVQVDQVGGACHEGFRSCFFRELDDQGQLISRQMRIFDPETTYSATT